jgi:hypothetical protein
MAGTDYEPHTYILEQEFRKRLLLLDHLLAETLQTLKDQLKHRLRQLPKEVLHMTLEEFLLQDPHFQVPSQIQCHAKDNAITSSTRKR